VQNDRRPQQDAPQTARELTAHPVAFLFDDEHQVLLELLGRHLLFVETH
jgi:hypothetical protein